MSYIFIHQTNRSNEKKTSYKYGEKATKQNKNSEHVYIPLVLLQQSCFLFEVYEEKKKKKN